VSEGQQHGFSSPDSWLALAASLIALIAFIVVEARSADPMLPPALLHDRIRRANLTAVFLLGAVFAGYVYFVSLYLQHVLGYSAVSTGLALVPATLTALIVATQLTRRLLPKVGAKRLLLIALVLVGIGQLWLSRMSAGGTYPTDVLGGIIFTAAGLGLAFPTASFTITSDVEPHQRGVAGGMFVTGQQVGAAVGLAVLATAAAARTQHVGSLVSGYSLSYVIATGLIVVALVVLGLTRPRTAPRPE
jgi:MFS family permease